MSDLIERLEAEVHQSDMENRSCHISKYIVMDIMRALSPIMPDDVAEMVDDLQRVTWYSPKLQMKAADLLERQRREIAQLKAELKQLRDVQALLDRMGSHPAALAERNE